MSNLCPQQQIKAQQGLPKCQSRARVGIYLGPSPTHSRSVNLVLNPQTGHISPQFHMKHDDLFETMKGAHNYDSLEATWRSLSGLVEGKTFSTLEGGSNVCWIC